MKTAFLLHFKRVVAKKGALLPNLLPAWGVRDIVIGQAFPNRV